MPDRASIHDYLFFEPPAARMVARCHGIVRGLDVRARVGAMQWNFPVNLSITCANCGKTFEIVLSSVKSTDHSCPHCRANHVFNFKKAETEMTNAAEDAMKKALEKAGF